MKVFLVTRQKSEDKRVWIMFEKNKRASKKNLSENGSGTYSFKVVEIPICEFDSTSLASIDSIVKIDFSKIIGNLIREASKVAEAEEIDLNCIDNYL